MTEAIRIIDRVTAQRCLSGLDPVELVEQIMRRHHAGATRLPAEGYLAWENDQGAYTRSVAMLGAITDRAEPAYGMKLINASVTNPALGMERAGGFTVLFDPQTARPVTLIEAGHISALRTAAYSVATVRRLGPENVDSVSILGCGTMARMHLGLMRRYYPGLSAVHAYDIAPQRAADLLTEVSRAFPDLKLHQHLSARECVSASTVVFTLTTSDSPYIEPDWLRPGSFVAHVSLDDLTEAVFRAAEAVYIDDLDLVRDNPRRILGAAMRHGTVTPPGTSPAGGSRAITGTFGQVLSGQCEALRPAAGFVVSNPFGMAILDVGIARVAATEAERLNLGTVIDLIGGAADGGR